MCKNKTLYIYKYNIGFYLNCDTFGNLTDIQLNIKSFLDNYLAEYIELPKKNYFDTEPNIKTYYNVYYDKENNHLYIHNNFLLPLIKYINNINYKIITNLPTNFKDNISLKLKKHIKDKSELQTHLIDWLINSKKSILYIPLQTGDGKTYCSIKFITIKKLRALIISPAYLQKNWLAEFKKFTNIKNKDIYIIKGKDSIVKLQSIKNPKFKIYLSTIQTLYSFLKIHTKEEFTNLLEKIKVSIKIIDEVHLNFRQLLKVDIITNFKYNIYLSATFFRTDKKSDLIFQTVFNKSNRYKKPEYKRYTNITECIYYNLGYIPENKLYTSKGYNEIKYEKYLIKHKNLLKYFITEVLFPILKTKYLDIKDKDKKCLILIKYKSFGEHLKMYLMKYFYNELSNYNIGCYFYEHTKEHRDMLQIIISTIQSSGTGSNIPNLRTVLVIDNFKARGPLIQVLGRLREIKNKNTELIYFQNNNLKAHRYYRSIKLKTLKPLAKEFKTINIY